MQKIRFGPCKSWQWQCSVWIGQFVLWVLRQLRPQYIQLQFILIHFAWKRQCTILYELIINIRICLRGYHNVMWIHDHNGGGYNNNNYCSVSLACSISYLTLTRPSSRVYSDTRTTFYRCCCIKILQALYNICIFYFCFIALFPGCRKQKKKKKKKRSKHSRIEGLFNLEMKKIKWRAYNRKAKGVEPGKYP